MNIRNAILILAVVWSATALLLARLFDADPAQRNVLFAPDMAFSPAYTAQEPRESGPEVTSLPTGVVPRGLAPFPYAADDDGRARAGRELKNPFLASDPAALKRGAAVFQSSCAVCHGPGGMGDGEVTKRGVPPPPSLLADPARKLSDGEIYHIITLGRKNMPAHAAQVARADRWRAVLHVRTLQGAKP